MPCSPTRRAGPLRTRPPNKTAPTPSTRLPPRGLKLKFFELNCPTPSNPCAPSPNAHGLSFPRALRWFLSWPGLLLERTAHFQNQHDPAFFWRKWRGNPRKRRDCAATAVSNNRVNEV